jgi:hypothetical protein
VHQHGLPSLPSAMAQLKVAPQRLQVLMVVSQFAHGLAQQVHLAVETGAGGAHHQV